MPVVRLIATLVAVIVGTGQAASAQPVDPAAIVDTFERARIERNVDAAQAQFADDAVITVQGLQTQSYVGHDQVRVYLQTLGIEYQPIMRSAPKVEGARVSWTERDQGPTQAVDATIQVMVFSDHIVSMMYHSGTAFGVATPTSTASAPTPPRELPSAAWPAGLLVVGLGVLAVASRRPRSTPSPLDGRLLSRMQRFRRDDDERNAA
jgi:hypothetical protein